jgi:choline-glycine betaine transporter
VAEPIVHFNQLLSFRGVEAGSEEALVFSMLTIFVHWTLAPYAIYTVAGLCLTPLSMV